MLPDNFRSICYHSEPHQLFYGKPALILILSLHAVHCSKVSCSKLYNSKYFKQPPDDGCAMMKKRGITCVTNPLIGLPVLPSFLSTLKVIHSKYYKKLKGAASQQLFM